MNLSAIPALVVRIADGFTMSVDHGDVHVSGDFETVEQGLVELSDLTGLELYATYAESN